MSKIKKGSPFPESLDNVHMLGISVDGKVNEGYLDYVSEEDFTNSMDLSDNQIDSNRLKFETDVMSRTVFAPLNAAWMIKTYFSNKSRDYRKIRDLQRKSWANYLKKIRVRERSDADMYFEEKLRCRHDLNFINVNINNFKGPLGKNNNFRPYLKLLRPSSLKQICSKTSFSHQFKNFQNK